MANPTNINVPPAKAADPTNINVPVHGTLFPSGVTGADQVVEMGQGSDLGNGVTNSVVDEWIAPFDGYLRDGSYQTITVAATCTFDLYNSTQSQQIVNAVTPVSNTAGTLTYVAAGQTFTKGDHIQLRVTTSGGAGACKGLGAKLFLTPTSGSTTNPV